MKDARPTDSGDPHGSRVALFSDLKIAGICLDLEHQARDAGYQFIAGLDEVGRGCLAGPVVAAACILDISKPLIKGLNDSKKLTPAARESIEEQLKVECITFAIGEVDAEEIDQINILEATKKAMRIALAKLQPAADFLLIDAIALKDVLLPQRPVIKGDSICGSIAAASILAKTYRDKLMHDHHAAYPNYGFDKHVGYGTAEHLAALKQHGACRLHRRSFHGVLH